MSKLACLNQSVFFLLLVPFGRNTSFVINIFTVFTSILPSFSKTASGYTYELQIFKTSKLGRFGTVLHTEDAVAIHWKGHKTKSLLFCLPYKNEMFGPS